MPQWGMHWLDSLGSWRGVAGTWCSAMSAGHYVPFLLGLESPCGNAQEGFMLFCWCSGRPHKLIISIARAWFLPVVIWSSLRCVKGVLVWPAVCLARISIHSVGLGFPLRYLAGLKNTSLLYVRNSMPCAYFCWVVFAGLLISSIHALLCQTKHGFRYWVTFWNKSEKPAPWIKSAGVIVQKKFWMSELPGNHVLNTLYGTLHTICFSGTNIRHEHCFQDEDSMQWLKRTSAQLWFQMIPDTSCPCLPPVNEIPL